MSRLNASTREAIVAAALRKAGIEQRIDANKAKRLDWQHRVRINDNGMSDEAIDAIYAEIKAMTAKLPNHLASNTNFYRYRSTANLNLGGARVWIEFPENCYLSYTPEPLPMGHPLVEEFHVLEADAEQLLDERKVLEAQLRTLLGSVTTVKKLLEIWPEAAELLPTAEVKSASNLPTVLVSSLNAAIGLPSDDKEAA